MKSHVAAALLPARAAEAILLGHAVSRLRLARNITARELTELDF
jgi:hypothetical protein